MNCDIHETLLPLATPIDQLVPLPNNPRVGSVEAIIASYEEFGQLKPIVARPNDDGTATVIAGNHQLEAAKHLGWDHIAVVLLNADDTRALAYALADNRTVELGHTDPSLLHDALSLVIEDYGDVMEILGWDDFEMAVLDDAANFIDTATPGVYYQPIIQTNEPPAGQVPSQSVAIQPVATVNEDGEVRLNAPASVDPVTAVATGSTSVNVAGGSRAIIQYTLVFDGPEQQRRWFDFVKWLRNNDDIEGETISAQVLNFVEMYAEF